MNLSFPPRKTEAARRNPTIAHGMIALRRVAACTVLAVLLPAGLAEAQAITINTKTGAVTNGTGGAAGTVDRRFQQIHPTTVPLPQNELDPKTRQELIRFLEADQGFAMRPFPMGHKGLTLAANGKLEPAGEGYLNMVTANGVCAKPGDRVVLTDVKIDHSRIIFALNGGPDAKHRFLRHIEIGGGTAMSPVVQGDEESPTGARLTLTFPHGVPELTGKQVEALLEPLISFEVKTPIQAFTDTLPPMLKNAILDHHVLVGMSTDMVLFAKGRPESKIREMDGQMPIEIWIYGKPPEDVNFVRINGNRVIRVEIAAVGKPVVVFTKDEVEGMMRTDGTPLVPGDAPGTRTVVMGDVVKNPDTQAQSAPPTLRNPGETLPTDNSKDSRVGVMKPVQFPKQKPDDDGSAMADGQQGTANSSSQTPAAGASSPATPAANPPQPTPSKPDPGGSQQQ